MDGGFHGGREDELDALLEESVDGVNEPRKVCQELAGVVYTLDKRTHLLLVLRHGYLGLGGDLVGIGAHAAGRDGASQKVGGDGAKLGFGRRNLQVILSYALEEGACIGDAGGGVGIEDNGVVVVGGDELKVFDDLVDYLDESAWGGAVALRQYKPLEESIRLVEGGQENDSRIGGDLMGRSRQIEQGRYVSFAQEAEELVD